MADKDELLDIIKKQEDLIIQLTNRKVPEVSDKESQTDVVPNFPKLLKIKNFDTQTEEKSNATPNRPKISFFRSKNLFHKKDFKKGPLCRDFNASGFQPPLTLTEKESVLPNSSPQISPLLKRTLSPDREKNKKEKTEKKGPLVPQEELFQFYKPNRTSNSSEFLSPLTLTEKESVLSNSSPQMTPLLKVR